VYFNDGFNDNVYKIFNYKNGEIIDNNTADDYYETINAIGNYPENECLFCIDPDVKGYAKVYPGSKFFADHLLDESKLNGIIIA
jgi:hypothetical protein